MDEHGVDLESKELEATKHNFWVHRQEQRHSMKQLEEQLMQQHEENIQSFELVDEDIDAIRSSTAQIEARIAASNARMERRSIELQDAILSISNKLNDMQLQSTSSSSSSRSVSTHRYTENSQSNSRRGEPHGQKAKEHRYNSARADPRVHQPRRQPQPHQERQLINLEEDIPEKKGRP